MIIAILYLLCIAAAELVTASVSIVGGITLHMVLLSFLIFHSSFAAKHPSNKLYLALALAPMIRIVSLTMPLSQFTQIYWYFFIAIPLLVASLIVIKILNFHPSEVSLSSGKLPVQGLVALPGIGFGLAEYHILRPAPLISNLTLGEILLPALILLVATGFVEELIFRGVMQRSSIETLGPWGWIYTAGVFSVLYISYLSAIYWLLVLLEGLLYGWIVKRTGSLLGVALSHGITNICLYLIIPLLI